MKNRLWVAAALPAAFVALSGCVYDDYSYGGWSGSYAAVGVGYSSPGYYSPGYSSYGYGYSPAYYDAFYDNFYGPIYGGYWHNDGLFYYQSYSGGPWYGDYSRHFRREHFRGGNQYRFEDRRQSGQTRPGSIADKIIRQDNPGWDGNRGDGGRNGGRGQGAPQQSFQGNPAPGGNRSGSVGGRDGRNGRGGLDGGPGRSSGESPAAAPPPSQQVSPPDSFRGQNRNGRGGNDGARFQDRSSDGQSDRQQSSRSSGPPRSSPPPSQRQSSGSGGWGGGGGGPKSEHRNKGGRH